MNVSTTTTIRLGAGPVTRAGWRCPSCGTNYSPDVTACHCSPLPAHFPIPVGPSIAPPPACPAHGQTEMMRVTC